MACPTRLMRKPITVSLSFLTPSAAPPLGAGRGRGLAVPASGLSAGYLVKYQYSGRNVASGLFATPANLAVFAVTVYGLGSNRTPGSCSEE